MPVSLASTGASTTHGAVVPIGYSSLGSATGSVAFSNIPQTYQDLYLVAQVQKTATGGGDPYINLNNDFTASSASRTLLLGDGSSASSSRRTSDSTNYIWSCTASSTIFATVEIWILNYAQSSTQKTLLWRIAQDLNGSGQTVLGVGRKNVGAITSVDFNSNGSASSSNWSTGSTFALYGVRTVGQ